jgi:D-aspartate ligase
MTGRILEAPELPPVDGATLNRRVGREVVGVVPNVESVNGLATLKGLGAAGVPCHALLEDMDAPGASSRYATERTLQPNPHHHPEAFLDSLSEIAHALEARGQIGVLVPTNDAVVKALAERPRAFGAGLVIHMPEPHVILATLDKKEQVLAARECGVPVPLTYFDTDLAPLFRDLDRGVVRFPLLIKGSGVLTWKTRKRFRSVPLETRAELDAKISEARSDDVEFVIQEIIPGDDDTLYTFGSYRTKAGHLAGTFTGRKLRQRPPRFGTCRVGESVYSPELVTVGQRFLEQMHYFGVSQVEFKWDERDRTFKLMEINPRSWSWIGLSIQLGINLPFLQLCDALGQPVPEQHLTADSPRGLWINYFEDFRWSIHRPRELPFLHFRDYPVICEPHFAENDPRPGRVYYASKIRGMAEGVLRRFSPRRSA